MPNDAEGTRHVFHIDGYKGYIIVNEYADKTPGEVFLRLGKPGSTVAGLIDGFTKLLSISLQFGVPLPKLIHSFVDTKFEPAGFTQNLNIRFAKSFYDYLFKYLDLKYYGGENTGLNIKKLVAEESESITPNSVDSLYPVPIPSAPVKKNLDSPPCTRCGSITVRNGSCHLCTNCGITTGCS
jgi:ribonucleoside-diphosphate reductase alpha chain